MTISVSQLASGFSIPWGLAQIDHDTLLVTEREGKLWKVDRFNGSRQLVSGLPSVWLQGQGGLLDVAVPRTNESSEWVYFTYSKAVSGGGATALARARLNENELVAWDDLIITRSVGSGGRHFGSRIAFDGQGHVYFSVGDRGERDTAQNLMSHAGSVLRLKLDGAIPNDNPFIANKNALPELWSVGHRNPQGMAFDYAERRLWSIEHGPRGGDEINQITAGKNYGWPLISYGKEYWGPVSVGDGTHKAGLEQPVKYYVPSIAPGSLLIYRGGAFPRWQGNLFAGALKLAHLNRVVIDRKGVAVKEERLLGELNERIRSIAESSEGWIYVATDSGNLYVLSPPLANKKGP